MIKDIIYQQKNEIQLKLEERFISRNYKIHGISNNQIKIITGPRRSGKSFFAMNELRNSVSDFAYVNFDDERLITLRNYDEIITAVNSVYGKTKYIFFDEIQNLDKWELFVNRLQRQNYFVIITGSNSNLLSRELSTHLTGRYSEIRIFPFSFKETLRQYESYLPENEIKDKFFSYLDSGGYPEPLLKNINHKEYLSILFDSVIYKDIVRRFKVRLPEGLNDLGLFLISNTAKEFSYNTLSKLTKCRSVQTVEKYLKYLQEVFLFFQVNRFSMKVKEQIGFNKKNYCIDNGFISSKSQTISNDTGRKLENLIAIDLYNRSIIEDFRFYFYKSLHQEEVDFVIINNNKVSKLIQVCLNPDSEITKNREIRALIKTSSLLGCDNLLLITGDIESQESLTWNGIKREIKFIPAWKWLNK